MIKKEWLLQQLKEKIDVFEKNSKQHKSLYRQFRYSVFVLTALSSVLSAIALRLPGWNATISLIIVFVSATVGIITSIEGIRKPAELWIHERGTYFALMDLRREVEFKLDENSSPDLICRYFRRMQEVLEAAGEKWRLGIAGKSKDPAGK